MEIITEKGEYYDLPEDYTIDFEFINPLLDDVGSQTAPGTLPYTKHNLRLLDYPNRMDRAQKYTIKRNVTLRENSFQKAATQLIMKANSKDKIVSTFYLDEAIFYEKVKNVRLMDIDWPVIYMFEYKMRLLFDDVMMLRREEDFCIFPVSIGFNGKEKTSDISNYEEPNWLNQIYYPAASLDSASEPKLWWRSSEDEQVPASNYGLTPFLRMSYIMEKIAEHLGYTFEYNVFRDHPAFRHLVLINNVIDSSIAQKIDYSLLMPDRTVSELVILLATKFGIKILCDDLNKKLYTLVIEDTITQQPDFDFTPFLTGEPKVEWTENGQLKLSSQTAFPGAAPFCESWQEFIKRFPDIPSINKRSEINLQPYVENGVYIKSENRYFIKTYDRAYGSSTEVIEEYYSSFFTYYDKQKNGSVVEFNASDEQLPMMEYDNTGTPSAADSVKNFKILVPNIDSCMHLVTRQFGERGDQSSMPFMFCFNIPYLQRTPEGMFPAGTTSKYDWNGNAWNDFSLNICGKDGIQEKLWKKYDEMIRHSYQSVTCSMDLPLSVLQNLKLYTPKMLFNQPVLIERIKCKIGNGKCKITEAVFRTLRSYED